MTDLVLANGNVLVGDDLTAADIIIDQGKIVGLSRHQGLPPAKETIDCSGLVVIPGVLDTHMHARDPGYTYKEDFGTVSRAAAAGGVTFFVDMPNTNPIPNTLELYLEHRALAEQKAIIDFNHWGMPTVLEEIPKIAAAGAVGFKVFMKSAHYPYGDDMAIVDDARIFETFQAIAAVDSSVVVHPHNQSLWTDETTKAMQQGRTTIRDWNRITYGNGDVLETTPIVKVVLLAEAAGVRLRVAHVQGRPQLRVVRMLKGAGFRFIVETNPWSFVRVDPIGIRSPENFDVLSPEDVEANFEAIRDGTIDLIASDHAPHTREESERVPENVFESLTIGMPIIEHWLSLLLTEVNKGRLTLREVVRAACEMPARTIGLYPRKGCIGVGADADLAVLDLNKEAILGDSYPVYSKAGFTPFPGYRVTGIPIYTIASGRVVMQHGEITAAPGSGTFVPVNSRSG